MAVADVVFILYFVMVVTPMVVVELVKTIVYIVDIVNYVVNVSTALEEFTAVLVVHVRMKTATAHVIQFVIHV